MTAENVLSTALIPLLMTGALVYFAVRILVFGDISSIRRENSRKKLKDEKSYAQAAGRLMLFLACVSGLMIPLIFVNVYVALGEAVLGIAIFGVLWRRMDSRYGE